MMPKELFKNAGIYIIASFLTQGLVFLLWIVLGRWLEPAQIGVYALALFAIEFFSAMSLLGLDASLVRFLSNVDRTPAVLTSGLILVAGSSVIVSTLFLTSAGWVSALIPGMDAILQRHMPLFVAIVLANTFANFAFASYTGRRKAGTYGVLQALKVVLFSLSSLVLVRLGAGIWGLFYGLLVSAAAVAVTFAVYERHAVALRAFSMPLLREMGAYGAPLMLYTVLGVVAAYFSRLLLARYTDATALGVYTFFLVLVLQINGVWSSFNRAWTPEIFARFEQRGVDLGVVWVAAYLSTFLYLVTLAIVVVCGEYLLFPLVFKEPYLNSLHLFYVLLLAPLFTGIYTVTYPFYYFENRTSRILVVSVILMGVSMGMTLLAVRFFQQTGAAATYVTAAALTPWAYLFAFRHVADIPVRLWYWMLSLTALMGLTVVLLLRMAPVGVFLMVLILGAGLSFRMGDLHHRRQLFLNLLKSKRFEPLGV